MCSALAAIEGGAGVLVLERSPEEERGGNSRFTAGSMRFAYEGVDDIRELVPDLPESELERTDFGSYPASQFFDDMARVTKYRADPDLVEILVMQSFDTLRWMRDQGIRFWPSYRRQAYQVDGRFKFWGGLALEVASGGPGLVESEFRIAEKAGAQLAYKARAIDLVFDGRAVRGVRVLHDGTMYEVEADAVVLAAGGFQANAEWRTRYLGPGWDLARVRGTWCNTGDGIRMALDVGAMPYGHWSGAHAVGWDLNAPEFGDLKVGDAFQKHSYPFGIMVNGRGERFVDEGADFRNYTYVLYGHAVIQQPDQFAWQVFDAKVSHLLLDDYRIQQVTKVKADTLEELADKMEDVDTGNFLRTVEHYNAAVQQNVEFDPNVKDGRAAVGVTPPKSNWANTIDTPPFEAYAVGCGITFTFGGLRIDESAQVIAGDRNPIPGLYAAGELVGGLFYHNYPGGSGLTAGSVFGRIAGTAAAAHSQT